MPNPLSYVLHTGTGSQTSFSFAGIDDYLSVGYIKVYLNDVLQTTGYTINATNETVNFSPTAPASGVKVKISRETPNTSSGFTGSIVDFSNGSILTADDLDKGFKGLLHIVQESNDTGSGALAKTTDQLGWNAGALPIKNAGIALDPTDLVTKAQLDSVALYGASTIPQSWEFTGTGSQLTFSLNPLPSSTASAMFIVEVGGVIQRPSTDYSITSNAIVFAANSAPGNNIGIRVRNFGVARNALDVIPSSSITNAYMAVDSISTGNIQDDAVTAAKLADNAVFTNALQNDAVTQAKIADDAVGVDQLASNSVGTDQLITSAVTGPKIANYTITSEKYGTASVNNAALGEESVAFANMKKTLFADSGNSRFLVVNAAGTLSASAASSVGFGGAALSNLDFGGAYKCTNLLNPTQNGDAVTKGYLEASRVGTLALVSCNMSGGTLTIDHELVGLQFNGTPSVFTKAAGAGNTPSAIRCPAGQVWKGIVIASTAITPCNLEVTGTSATYGGTAPGNPFQIILVRTT